MVTVTLPLLLDIGPVLGGRAAGLAAGALGTAMRSGEAPPNAHPNFLSLDARALVSYS